MIIGITGSTGSGKTYISNILKNEGAYIINADKICHENLLYNKDIIKEIIDYFGKEILDENKVINRKKLSNIVFTDKNKLLHLNKISHKYIIYDIKKIIENNKKKYNYIVLDAPLLIETNLYKLCNKILLVYADIDTRIERIIKRDNITKQEALNRINSQNKFENLINYADVIIENNKDNNIDNIKKLLNKYKVIRR